MLFESEERGARSLVAAPRGAWNELVRHVLRQMRDEGLLVSDGKGRGAKWRKVEDGGA